MIIFIEILIFISAMYFIGYPLFSRKGVMAVAPKLLAEDELVNKKEAVYTAIKDLEFDYKTAKLSEADYRELKDRSEIEALQILKEIDERKEKKPAPERFYQGTVKPMKEIADGSIIFCPMCGTKIRVGDNFCFRCGAKLPGIQT